MRKCRCCKQRWPEDCFNVVRHKVTGKPYLRGRCQACQYNCGDARRRRAVQTTARYRARIREEVASVRAARSLQ